MNFIEALELAKQGKKIRIKTWENTNFYIWLKLNVLYDINDYEFCSFTLDDYMSLDWEVYREEPELHTFEEAITALKEGKKIKRLSSTVQFWHHKPESGRRPLITVNDSWLGIVDNCFSTEEIFANDWIIGG